MYDDDGRQLLEDVSYVIGQGIALQADLLRHRKMLLQDLTKYCRVSGLLTLFMGGLAALMELQSELQSEMQQDLLSLPPEEPEETPEEKDAQKERAYVELQDADGLLSLPPEEPEETLPWIVIHLSD